MNRAALLLVLAAMPVPVLGADDPALPGRGYDASHYETLWTKSPFAVATPDAAPISSDYSLVGVAQNGGVSYASVVSKQNQEHFLVSSNKPINGLTLVSVTRGHDSSDTSVVMQKDGQTITLKMEEASMSPAVGGLPNAGVQNLQPGQAPQIAMPGAAPMNNFNFPGRPPRAAFHNRVIHLPTPPPPQQTPQSQ